MLSLKEHSLIFPNSFHPVFNTTADLTWITNQFEQGNIDTRADIITQLWTIGPDESTASYSPANIIDRVVLGMKLYDIMYCARQLQLVRDRIDKSASQVFDAAVRQQINLDRLDDKIKARLCAMTLSSIPLEAVPDNHMNLHNTCLNIGHFLTIPPELAGIIPANRLMERTILDAAIQLLALGKEVFLSTTSLLYNPHDNRDPLNVADYLKEVSRLWKDNATEKLNRLIPGQKLMIPIQSTSIDNATQQATDGHFSAILAIKTTEGLRFYIFDSSSSSDMENNKEMLIKTLIAQDVKYSVDYFQRSFQSINDCGFHTYNFFKLCINSPSCTFDNPQIMVAIFDKYVETLTELNKTLDEVNRASSYLLRLHFVLDCIRNGYTPGLQDTEEMISQLYRPLGGGEPSGAEKQDPRRSATLWRNLRSNIGNVFSLRSSGRKIKHTTNDIPLEAWRTIGKAELKKNEGKTGKPV